MRRFMVMAMAFLLAVPMTAQQIEVNDVGGSLTNAGTNPIVGAPIVLGLVSTFSPRIQGSVPNSGFIFAGGVLANPSTQFGLLNGQWWDLVISTTTVIGDGIGGTGDLPFLYFLNANNQCNFTLSSNTGLNGLSYAFQAITVDPTKSPLALNVTAALAYTWTNPPLNFSADDAVQNYVFPSGFYTIYGVGYGSISVSTNGWVRFGVANQPDNSETVAEFLAGTPSGVGPGGPMIAVDWEDLTMGNLPNPGSVTCQEVVPGITEVRWINGQYFPSSVPWGTILLRIDRNGGAPIITMDYSAFTPPFALFEGLIGISDGQLGGAGVGPDFNVGFVSFGQVNSYGPIGTNFTSYYQTFDGTGAPGGPGLTPINVGGEVITWADMSGFGDWAIF